MTPFEVSWWVFEWCQTYIGLAWWGHWFILLLAIGWAGLLTNVVTAPSQDALDKQLKALNKWKS